MSVDQFHIKGFNNTKLSAHIIQNALGDLEGVNFAVYNSLESTLTVDYDENATSYATIKAKLDENKLVSSP